MEPPDEPIALETSKRTRAVDDGPRTRPSKRGRAESYTAPVVEEDAADLLETKADSLQQYLNQEVNKVLGDFRVLLERTMKAENEAYGCTQYTTQDVRQALAASVEAAASAVESELRPGFGGAGRSVRAAPKGRKLKRNELHHACVSGQLEAVRTLTVTTDVNEPSLDGFYPLFLAVKGKHADIVEHLLVAGANACALNGAQEIPALHQAVKANCLEIVKLLIKHGADREQPNKAGATVFDFKISLSMWSALKNTPGPSDQFEPLSARVGARRTIEDRSRSAVPSILRTPTGLGAVKHAASAPAKRKLATPKPASEARQARKLFKHEPSVPDPNFGIIPPFSVTTEFFLGKSANE